MQRIVKTAGVCGGAPCVAGTRIPVWSLVEHRGLGMLDARILEEFPALKPDDLLAAWDYASRNPLEIDRALWLSEAGMLRHDGRSVPAALLRRGRELGFSDEELSEAFEPALAHQALRAGSRNGA